MQTPLRRQDTVPVSERTAILPRLLPLYAVIFAGFVGYSLMITVFTPLLLHPGSALLPPRTATGTRSLILGGLLALYPLGQFFSSPMLGSLSDRVGRRPVLLASLSLTTGCYALIVWSLYADWLWLLALACLCAGAAEFKHRVRPGCHCRHDPTGTTGAILRLHLSEREPRLHRGSADRRETRRFVPLPLVRRPTALRPRLPAFRLHDAAVIALRFRDARSRCLVPGSCGATLTREEEEALWQAVFTAAPEQRREFEPSSRRRKRRPASWPSATG